MKRRPFTKGILGLACCLMIGLISSLAYSSEQLPPGTILPEFKLKGLDSPKTKSYLGINEDKPFSLSQIKTKLVLVEFFDVFCPVCQKNAPIVNRLYNVIKEDKNLGKDVKLIGIALGVQPKDLEVYRKTFKVEFPLFADPNKEIEDRVKVKVKFVPLLVLLDNKGKSLMDHTGAITNFDGLLAEIRKIYKAQ
jgi:thiol-disulfide isomerase/thioredoxin